MAINWQSLETVGKSLIVIAVPFFTVWLTDRYQKRRWMADNKKEEYRELLRSLNEAMQIISQFHGPLVVRSGEDERKIYESTDEALIVIDTRLFIRKEIQKLNVRDRWLSAVTELDKGGHILAFLRNTRAILKEIADEAEHIFK